MSVVFGPPVAGKLLGSHPGGGVPWLAGTTLALSLALALAPWLGRRAAAMALAVPAGALDRLRRTERNATDTGHSFVLLLIVMAALAALSGGPVRLPRSWLWLPCAIPLALATGYLLSPGSTPSAPAL